jgi:hypothetical protein
MPLIVGTLLSEYQERVVLITASGIDAEWRRRSCGSVVIDRRPGSDALRSFPLVRRETFPSEPTRQTCDHDQRGQGCAALKGFQDGLDLDLDRGARRGRMMVGD